MNTVACILTLGWHALLDAHLGPILVALLVVLAMASVTAFRFLRYLWRSVTKIV